MYKSRTSSRRKCLEGTGVVWYENLNVSVVAVPKQGHRYMARSDQRQQENLSRSFRTNA